METSSKGIGEDMQSSTKRKSLFKQLEEQEAKEKKQRKKEAQKKSKTHALENEEVLFLNVLLYR
jgi:hypothetical protein